MSNVTDRLTLIEADLDRVDGRLRQLEAAERALETLREATEVARECYDDAVGADYSQAYRVGALRYLLERAEAVFAGIDGGAR